MALGAILRHPGEMLEVSFVRRRGSRDRVYVRRDDGSSTGWDFPSYGDGLPHDLCHLSRDDFVAARHTCGIAECGAPAGQVGDRRRVPAPG